VIKIGKLGPYTASYIVHKGDDGKTYVKNGDTGQIEFVTTRDEEAIRYAINNIGSGGTIHIRRSTYIINSTIGVSQGSNTFGAGIPIIGKTNIRIVGEGEGATVIKLGNGVGGTILYYDSAHYLELCCLTFDGNKDNNVDSGIDGDLTCVKGHATYFAKIVNVEFRNCVRQGFYPTNCSWSHYENLYAHDNGYEGIVLDAEKLSTVINLKTNNNQLYGGAAGLYITGGATTEPSYLTIIGGIHYNNSINVKVYNAIGVEIYGIKAYYSRASANLDGIWIQNSKDVKLIGVEAVGNARGGILIVDSSNVHIIGSLVKNNGQDRTSPDRAGIILTKINTGVSNIYISDSQIYDDQRSPSQLYGIRIPNVAYILDTVVIHRSILTPNMSSPINVYDPTKVKVYDNVGVTTKNYGTATIPAGQTSVTVSHGLVAAPSKVIITPLAQPPGPLWVSNITSTSFTINVSTAPTTDLQVAWYAEV